MIYVCSVHIVACMLCVLCLSYVGCRQPAEHHLMLQISYQSRVGACKLTLLNKIMN